VPRTKEFRPEEALDAAMHLFWLKGYGATSMRDLLDGMGIGRGSFYDTFGDKHALFLAALDRFEEARTSWVDEALDGSGMDGIEEVFRRTVAGMTGSEPRRGCLLANTAVELAPRDPEVAARISRYVRRTEEAFAGALVRAGEAGEIPADRNPRALARFLVSNLHGLRVLARAGTDRRTLEDAARVALEALRQRPDTQG
jgi:TetR/AcrR family transcriptional regulator, transcriptional repressor for nem operon